MKVTANMEKRPHSPAAHQPPVRLDRDERALSAAVEEVRLAQMAFDARWTQLALRRADYELYDKLNWQVAKWQEVRRSEPDAERATKVARATIRGYRRAVEVMEAVSAPDDVYEVAMTSKGLVVTFGPMACAPYLSEKYPGSAHFTYDEAAELLSNISMVTAVKAAFPGCQVVRDERLTKGEQHE